MADNRRETTRSRTRTPRPVAEDLRIQRLRDQRVRAFLDTGSSSPGSSGSSSGALDDLIARTAQVYAEALTPQTRTSYVSRWNHFAAWANENGFDALPAASETVMLYFQSLADGEHQVAVSTLRGRLAAINRVHFEAGFPSPGSDPAMAVFLRGLVRMLGPGARRDPVRALRVADLRAVARSMPIRDARMIRDRAILSLHASGVSDEGIARLQWRDVIVRRKSARITDCGHLGVATTVTVTDRDPELPAFSALLAWRAITTNDPAPVFTTTDATGRRSRLPVSPADIRRTVTARLAAYSDADSSSDLVTAVRCLGGPDPLALRDRAMLLLGFAGAFRRVDLVMLRWSDVREDPDGLIVHLRYSKTDRRGVGRDIGIPYGKSAVTCPVSAVSAWHDAVVANVGAATAEHLPIFVTVGRSGRLGSEPMTAQSVTRVLVSRARDAGLEGKWGGRSLRAGFITTAAELEIPLEEIARQSRHATIDSLVRYIRREDLFHKNAADRVGL